MPTWETQVDGPVQVNDWPKAWKFTPIPPQVQSLELQMSAFQQPVVEFCVMTLKGALPPLGTHPQAPPMQG